MYEAIRSFKQYLHDECRYPDETIVNFLGNLPIVFDQLNITHLSEIKKDKIRMAWRHQRWSETELGIEVSEKAELGGLAALKEFLCYLEDKGLVQKSGLSEIINIQQNRRIPLRSLSENELQMLREFLVFNVGDDTRRRETALCFFLLTTGLKLAEALSLNVHKAGHIIIGSPNVVSGHFHWNGRHALVSATLDKDETGFTLADETLHFLNFYLENRKYTHRFLFLSDIRSNAVKRLAYRSAERLIENVLKKAGLTLRSGSAVAVMQETGKLFYRMALASASVSETINRYPITENVSNQQILQTKVA